MMQFSQSTLKTWLSYDSSTGIFIWRRSRGRVSAGTIAGTRHSEGGVTIQLCGARHHAHRLAWLYVTGEWPKDEIDHKDLDRSNNRFANLREATRTENQRNVAAPVTNTSGRKGVVYRRDLQKWQAQIGHERRCVYLGLFSSKEAASAAYNAASARLHGKFARASCA